MAGEGIDNLFVNAMIQEGTISLDNINPLATNVTNVAAQVVRQAEVEVEKLVAAATWPCKPDIPVCVMPGLVRSRLASTLS